MEPVAGDSTLLEDFSEDELESAFNRMVRAESVAPPPQSSPVLVASERLHGVDHLSDLQRMAQEEVARAQTMAAGGEWFLESDGEPVGPLSTAEVKEQWSQG